MGKRDLSGIRYVSARETCWHCGGKARVSGGRYKSQGEMVACPVCHGAGCIPVNLTIDALRELLKKPKRKAPNG
jgi:DnaJ-class molecular chaperone